MGIGHMGIGDWGLGPIPNPQSPIPNPQSPIPIFLLSNLFCEDKNEFELFEELVLNGLYVFIFIIF